MMDKNKVFVAIAPIVWTNDDLPELGGHISFEQCISEMAEAGYIGSEIGNKYPRDIKVLRSYLEKYNHRICGQWFSGYILSQPFEKVKKDFKEYMDFLYDTGARAISFSEQSFGFQGTPLPIFEHKVVYNDDNWKKFTDGINELGHMATEKGMRLCLHHHMGTGVQTEEEIDRFMEMTEPGKVWLLHDAGHLYFAGCDPLRVLKKYVKRVGHVHLKNVRANVLQEMRIRRSCFLEAVYAGAFTVPGDPEGAIDYAPIFQVLEEGGYEGWMMVEAEQDPDVANPLHYAKMGREYIRKCTGL
jgi:inosose dehydratase